MTVTYSEAPNQLVSAATGTDYAYRQSGEERDGPVPLVLLQHFRGNLDNWDHALIDALTATRPVVTFDNAGVGGSSGTTPPTVTQMARDAIAFLDARLPVPAPRRVRRRRRSLPHRPQLTRGAAQVRLGPGPAAS